MKNLFPAYYRLSQEDLDKAIKESVFIVDTNVLLNLYRLPLSARTDLLRILTALSERNQLWVPYQVALERVMDFCKLGKCPARVIPVT